MFTLPRIRMIIFIIVDYYKLALATGQSWGIFSDSQIRIGHSLCSSSILKLFFDALLLRNPEWSHHIYFIFHEHHRLPLFWLLFFLLIELGQWWVLVEVRCLNSLNSRSHWLILITLEKLIWVWSLILSVHFTIMIKINILIANMQIL